MRIALVSEHFYPTLGGVQEHLYYCVRELIRLGHEPVIITPRVGNKPIESWWPKDLPLSCYKNFGRSLPFFSNGSVARITANLFSGSEMARLLSPENFDIAHIHAPMSGTISIIALRYASIPCVGTWHTSFGRSLNFSVLRKLIQRYVDSIDVNIGVAPMAITCPEKYVKFKNVEIIPNGVDTNFFRPLNPGEKRLPTFDDGRVNIFFIGRPDPRNGLDTLLKAFAQTYRSAPEARLIVAGGGNLMPHYQRLAKSLLPENAVTFLGPVREQRPELYRSADIQVFNVERATCAITLLEGMASGLTVAVSSFEGHEFIGTPNRDFVTTPYADVNVLAQTLLELVKNPSRRKALGQAARQRSLDYDWKVITQRILNVYQRVVPHLADQAPDTVRLHRPAPEIQI